LPEYIGLTSAWEHDLSAFKQISPLLQEAELYADSAYISALESELMEKKALKCKHLSRKKRVKKPCLSLNNYFQH
jgi:hypothetical protein